MDKYEQENQEIINIINNNATRKRAEAYLNSKSEKKIIHKPQKRKNRQSHIKQALAVILTIATITSTAAITHTITTNILENNNVIISTAESKDVINDKIEAYEKLMNMYSDKENSIEIYVGRNFNTPKYEANVDYNINNLTKHIVEAAKKSEVETRCAIIAAYRIINEPYRDKVIGTALSKASAMQEEYNYKIPESSEEFLEQQGYETWDDYNMNERNNIKDLYAVEQYLNEGNRKVM